MANSVAEHNLSADNLSAEAEELYGSNEVIVHVQSINFSGSATLGQCKGVEVESGDLVVFVAETRYCAAMAEAAGSDEPVFASVPLYSILQRASKKSIEKQAKKENKYV